MKTLKPFNIAAILLLFSGTINAQYWRLVGNSGTDPSRHFLGTTDEKPLVFKVNNNKAGYIDYDSSKGNTAFGYQSLFSNTSGKFNTANGYRSLNRNTRGNYNTATGVWALTHNDEGTNNTANGYVALQGNSTGSDNTAIGSHALYLNTTGIRNTATGSNALSSNTVFPGTDGGYENTANGYNSLFLNVSGYYNTASGSYSMYKNESGYSNTANGVSALYSNTTGFSNTASGAYSLNGNITGRENTATGAHALYANTLGSSNTANGKNALEANVIGSQNTAIGAGALAKNISGSYNTAIGSGADVSDTRTVFYNTTAIGAGAIATASNATAIGSGAKTLRDNQVMLGNTAVVSVMAAGHFVIVSDGRFKNNRSENVPGLAFIKELKPVTYHYNIRKLNEHIRGKESIGEDLSASNSLAKTQMEEAIANKEKKLYTGFVAQEVEAAANKLGYDFSGVYKPQNEKDAYGLSYSEFVVPLVKAVQDLSKMNDEKDKVINELKSEIRNLKSEMNELKSMISGNSSITNFKLQTANLTSASLEQNIPNPFTNTTTINYTLPQNFTKAQLVISDKTGRILKQMNLSGAGKGTTQINASAFSSGAYNYSLYVDGRLITTKQLVLMR